MVGPGAKEWRIPAAPLPEPTQMLIFASFGFNLPVRNVAQASKKLISRTPPPPLFFCYYFLSFSVKVASASSRVRGCWRR